MINKDIIPEEVICRRNSLYQPMIYPKITMKNPLNLFLPFLEMLENGNVINENVNGIITYHTLHQPKIIVTGGIVPMKYS